jgi:Tol biopolymer transport system component
MSNLGAITPTAEFKKIEHYYARFAVPLIVLGVILACSGGFLLATSQEWGNAMLAKTLVVLFGLGLFAVGWYVWFKDWREPDLRVLVFPNGILMIKEGIEITALWDDIAAVWQSKVHRLFGIVTVNASHAYTIQLADGREFRFHGAIENVVELGNIIQQHVTKHRLPHTIDALEKGDTVPFGELSANAQGLSYRQRTLLWRYVEGFEIKRNSIVIRERGNSKNWASVKVTKIPNLSILLALVAEYRSRSELRKPPIIRPQTLPPLARPRVGVARTRRSAAHRVTRSRWIVAAVVGLPIVAFVFWGLFGEKIQLYDIINDAALSPDGERLVSVHGQGRDTRYTLRVWDTATGEQLHKLYSDNLMWIVEWSPDGRLLATGNAVGITIWDTSDWHIRHYLLEATEKSNDLAWSPDNQHIASGDLNGFLRVWDVGSGDLVHKLRIHIQHISAVDWSPDGKLLATGSWDNSVKVTDAASGILLHTFSQDTSYISELDWASDSQRLASGCLTGVARIFDVAEGRELHAMEAHRIAVRDLAWSPDGNLLATLGNDEVDVWDSASGQIIDVLDNLGAYESNVVWSPDGQQIASGGRGMVRVWTMPGAQRYELSGHDQQSGIVVIGWSSDSERLFTIGTFDETIRIWNVPDQTQLYVMGVSKTEAVWNALLPGR